MFTKFGWMILAHDAGKKELIKAISKIQSQSTTNPCSISQVAAKHALQSEKDFLQDWLKKFESRKNLLHWRSCY